MVSQPGIRDAVAADVAAMTQVAGRAYAPALARIADLPDVVDGIAADMATHPALVAEIAGQVAGFAIMIPTGAALKLANMAVDPDFAGQGVARALMAAVEVRARAAGACRLELVTHAGMTRASGLYRHLGWQETGHCGNAVFMALPL